MVLQKIFFRKFPLLRFSSLVLSQSRHYTPKKDDVIFSGIQPTGIPHIGNYLGAIKHWVQLQQSHDNVIYCIVDLHSITKPQNPQLLKTNITDMTLCLLACGLDPAKSIIFQQSMVQEHCELAWILSCLTTLAQLQHQPQWRDKSSDQENPGIGLLTYPVLQSADILLYKSRGVPVGEDQIKHIELTRHHARTFNKRFGQYFPEPATILTQNKRIKNLKNPNDKMSKSDPNSKTRIELTDSDDVISRNIKKAVTDSLGQLTYDPVDRPGVANLIDIHCGLTGLDSEDVCRSCSSMNMSTYKSHLADIVIESLRPIRDEYVRLKTDEGYVSGVLEKGAQQARNIASVNMTHIKKLIGIA